MELSFHKQSKLTIKILLNVPPKGNSNLFQSPPHLLLKMFIENVYCLGGEKHLKSKLLHLLVLFIQTESEQLGSWRGEGVKSGEKREHWRERE